MIYLYENGKYNSFLCYCIYVLLSLFMLLLSILHHSLVVRDALLWCRKSPGGHEIANGFCHLTTRKLSVNPEVNGYLP